MKWLTCVVSVLLSATSGFARIGETQAQCTERYGKVIRHERSEKPDADCLVYAGNVVRIGLVLGPIGLYADSGRLPE